MFVCESCLRKNYTNEPGFMQSYGPCEDCRVTTTCSDIPSRALTPKASHDWELAKAHGQADYIMSLKGGYVWTCTQCKCQGESQSMHKQPVSSKPCVPSAAGKARHKIRAEAAPKAISHLDAMENLLGDDD
jgi:hypothetical protein